MGDRWAGCARISNCFIPDFSTNQVVDFTSAAIDLFTMLEDEVYIVQNAIEAADAPTIEDPKMPIPSAVEGVNPMPGSLSEAQALGKSPIGLDQWQHAALTVRARERVSRQAAGIKRISAGAAKVT